MKTNFTTRILFTLLFFAQLITGLTTNGQIRLPKLVSDGMILQRETPVNIWGWANAGEKVNLSINNQSFETVTSADGKWKIILPAQKAGGPFNMEITASNHITLTNILFGDVWLCSGQSNIEYPMNRLKDRYSTVIKECSNSAIRQFKIPTKYDFNAPIDDYSSGSWIEVNPESILNFSAVAYFFARELYEKYKIPIGIINASVGGSPAQSWMSIESIKEFPTYFSEAEKFKNPEYITKIQDHDKEISKNWYAKLNKNDKGLLAQPTWKDPANDISTWSTMQLPGYWANESLGKVNGVVWFRKEIDVKETMVGQQAWIEMGRIVDADSVFINGIFVGTTSYQYPQRKYEVRPGILKAGKNCITIRVINNSGNGGFVKDKPYRLSTSTDTVKLTGDWNYRLGTKMKSLPGQTFVQWKPTGLHNGMIAPSTNYTIKGVVWYQGESNTNKPQEYQKLLTSLINDWRLKRNQGNFPFIIVQLPNFMNQKEKPSQSKWAEFRNAQLKTLSVENTALVVTIDLGEWNDIHPQNKLDVGKRIALAASKIGNNEQVVFSGPMVESVKIDGNKVIIHFSECGGGLTAKNGNELNHFAIAGATKKFVWAKAKIEGNKVIVWNDAVKNPKIVRYAWADNPVGANLYNKEGLPASPFTTKE